MSAMSDLKFEHRYWGKQEPPKSKSEFFNAVTVPSPTGEGTVATIRMYGPIDSWGGYWGISTADIGAVLDGLPDTVDQIVLRINSPGGEVFEGVSILNMLRAHKASVTAVVDGLAASAASVIAAGCDDVVMSPGTQMMIHSPWSFAGGNAADLRKSADLLDGIERSLIEIYEGKAGANDWAGLLAAETWLTADESVQLGLADRVGVVPDAGVTGTVGAPVDEDVEDSATVAVLAKLPASTETGETIRKGNVMGYDDLKNDLRTQLGIADVEASDESLVAAVAAAKAAAVLPDGVVAVDSTLLDELKAQAAAGVEAQATAAAERREALVVAALADGRIAPASADVWRAQLEANEEGASTLLASLATNTIPVSELGGAPVDALDEDAAINAWASADKKGA